MLVFDQIRLVVVNLWTVVFVGSVDTLRPYAYDRILQLRAVARQAAVDLSGNGYHCSNIRAAQYPVQSFRSCLLHIRRIFVGQAQVVEQQHSDALWQDGRLCCCVNSYLRLPVGFGDGCGLASDRTTFLQVECRDRSQLAFIEDLKVFFLQVCDHAALLVAHHDGHQYPVNIDVDRRGTVLWFGLRERRYGRGRNWFWLAGGYGCRGWCGETWGCCLRLVGY